MRRDKLRSFGGVLLTSTLVGSIQTLVAGFVFMLMAGIIHAELIPAISPLGFISSCLLLAGVQIVLVTVRMGIDYRRVLEDILDIPARTV